MEPETALFSDAIDPLPTIFSQFLIVQTFDSTALILLGAILVLIICSGLVSGSETALFSLSPKEIEKLREEKLVTSILILELIKQPRYLISTILIANNFINVSIALLSYFAIGYIFEFGAIDLGFYVVQAEMVDFIVNLIITVTILVQFGEVAPKIYANGNKESLARFMARPLTMLLNFFRFIRLSTILVKSVHWVETKIKVSNNQSDSKDELMNINKAIELTAGEEATKADIDLLKGIVNLGAKEVSNIMRNRMDVKALDIEDTFEEVLKNIQDFQFSRMPVINGDIDKVEGILHIKDLIGDIDQGAEYNWQQHIREAHFVPENKRVDDLLNLVQAKRNHLFIVVDEYGGTSGIVTLEDAVEQVLGQINDEFEVTDNTLTYRKLNSNTYVFAGKYPIIEVQRITGIDFDVFDEVRGDADSIGGLVIEIAGKFVETNETISWEQFDFTVLDFVDDRIETLQMHIRA